MMPLLVVSIDSVNCMCTLSSPYYRGGLVMVMVVGIGPSTRIYTGFYIMAPLL